MIQILEAIFKEIKVLGKFLGLYWKSVRLHWGQQGAYSDTLVLNKNFWPEPSGNREEVACFWTSVVFPFLVLKQQRFLRTHAIWVLKRIEPPVGRLDVLNFRPLNLQFVAEFSSSSWVYTIKHFTKKTV